MDAQDRYEPVTPPNTPTTDRGTEMDPTMEYHIVNASTGMSKITKTPGYEIFFAQVPYLENYRKFIAIDDLVRKILMIELQHSSESFVETEFGLHFTSCPWSLLSSSTHALDVPDTCVCQQLNLMTARCIELINTH